ncbi:MAG: GNAT family N-acetyltransferase [Pseudomonadota bacterium]
MLAKGAALYELLRDDLRFTYYGRGVGVATETEVEADPSIVLGLAKLQGATNIGFVTEHKREALLDMLAQAGLSVTEYAYWAVARDALHVARAVTSTVPLAPGLTLHRVTPVSPPSLLRELARTAASCDVLLPNVAVLDGSLKPGLALLATNEDGEGVACAGAASFAHPGHPSLGKVAWWGMLATRPDWRGQGLALHLGAQSLIGFAADGDFTSLMTGIVPGNTASESVCRKLGLAPTGAHILTIVDAAALPDGKLTS